MVADNTRQREGTVVAYRKDERGRREFDVAGRRYRASWMSMGRHWSLTEVGLDGLKIAPEGKAAWTDHRKWAQVEAFVEWRARLSGAVIASPLRILPEGQV